MVMYRDFAARKARTLLLCGSAQNMEDGSVSVVAEGEETQLVVFIKKLHQGPILAHVENVNCVWREPKNEYMNFTIVYK